MVNLGAKKFEIFKGSFDLNLPGPTKVAPLHCQHLLIASSIAISSPPPSSPATTHARRRLLCTGDEQIKELGGLKASSWAVVAEKLKTGYRDGRANTSYRYPKLNMQRDIVIACVAVHNFIRKYDIEDQLFPNFEQNTMVTPNVGGGGSEGQNIEGIEWGSEAVDYMIVLRDQIANQLFSND
ncbi:unnamed protein product [Lactuca saligna]|uniref:DDE Tnp4 domain-containing protein n=1 Tax=Lactuca saligna TaxID=75948 RepID=A0AA35YBU9_LACSI|nr:unnamed protein product [Lactuca saligna]